MSIVVLPSNRPPERFYRGGIRITDFRGEPSALDHEPEDWVASTTALAGESSLGMTVLPDGRSLAAAIRDDPASWLGSGHVAAFGVDTKLLVKLLDAGQRLPVHAHPHVEWARAALGRAHGKAEAWHILTPGVVHLGLTRDVAPDELRALIDAQDTEGMLTLLNRVEVATGDTVYVPPGTLHAIGAGVFLLELQEPEDLSILIEWDDFDLDGPRDGHLGLGFDAALEAVDREKLSAERLAGLIAPRRADLGTAMLPPEAAEYFRLERVLVDGEALLEVGFAVLVVTEGTLTVEPADQRAVSLTRGMTAVTSFSAGSLRLVGRGEVLVCRPPTAP